MTNRVKWRERYGDIPGQANTDREAKMNQDHQPTWLRSVVTGAKRYGPDQRVLQDFEVMGLAAIYWPEVEVIRVLRVSRCESGLNTGAWNEVGEDSRGLLQLNLLAHPQWARWNLFDPQINFWFGYHLWLAEGWRPWTCAHTLGFV
jgi:hypothetical protein